MTATAAAQAIERSRERLRRALQPQPASPARAGVLDAGLQRLRRLPLVAPLLDSVAAWWAQHPLRPISQVAAEASNALTRPLAQRHPLLLVLAAGLLGAGLAWSRPRRWIFSSALFAGLMPQFVARVAASLPIDSWAAMLAAASAATPPPDTFREDTSPATA